MLILRLFILISLISTALFAKKHRHDQDFQYLIKICQETPSQDLLELIDNHIGKKPKASRGPASIATVQNYYTEEDCTSRLLEIFLNKES